MPFLAASLALILSAGLAHAAPFDLLRKTGPSVGPISVEAIDIGVADFPVLIEDLNAGVLTINYFPSEPTDSDFIFDDGATFIGGPLQHMREIVDGAELLFAVDFDATGDWGNLVLATLLVSDLSAPGTQVFDDGAQLDVTLDAVQPIPLPAAAWLLMSGVAALAGVRSMRTVTTVGHERA